MMPRRTATKPAQAQRASILICVLVCLAVSTALVTSMVHNALQSRREIRTQHQVRQAELLLAAGVQRAAQQLQLASDYLGEEWTLALGVIPHVDSGRVTIYATRAEGKRQRKVSVTAHLLIGDSIVVQRSYSFSTKLNNSKNKE